MNIYNLLKMAHHIKTIHISNFDMAMFDAVDGKGNYVRDVIGHCITLDDKENIPYLESGDIDFAKWSESFTGLYRHSNEWYWLFSDEWQMSDNTPRGAAKRIVHFVKKGLPDNWTQQLRGRSRLCYKNIKL